MFPRLEYAAALLGPGSEVAGFDTRRSTDHDWGPRLQVFLTDSDSARHAGLVTAMLASRLPATFRGHPVAFPVTREPDGTARQRVEVTGLGTWLTSRLGFDPRQAVTLLDWLAIPAQRLADRPYQVIGAGRFAAALREAITDPRIRELPLVGAIDQFIDGTDAVGDLRFLRACAATVVR